MTDAQPLPRMRVALGAIVRFRWDPKRPYRVLRYRCTWSLEHPPVLEYGVAPDVEQDAGVLYWCGSNDLTRWRQPTMQEPTP
jgi:hypothetical protein